jgi:hypothetical protein
MQPMIAGKTAIGRSFQHIFKVRLHANRSHSRRTFAAESAQFSTVIRISAESFSQRIAIR